MSMKVIKVQVFIIGAKPVLSSSVSSRQTDDPKALKKKLLEKEAQVEKRRLKELSKLQLKLSRQEEHAEKIRERKQAIVDEGDDEKLEYGGEGSPDNEDEEYYEATKKLGKKVDTSSKTLVEIAQLKSKGAKQTPTPVGSANRRAVR